MSDDSAIEWTDATWNPVRGCSRVSPGCGGSNHEGGCYAERLAARFSGPGQLFHGFAERTPHGGRWTGKLALIEDMLTVPLRWKKPRRIFVNSMSDLFHESLPDDAIDKVFAVMALAPQHTFQVLTKRAQRMRRYVGDSETRGHIFKALHDSWPDRYDPFMSLPWPLPNVWLGVSVERQQEADERIPLLLDTPAAVRFLSCEPLLGPIDLTRVHNSRGIAPSDTFDAFAPWGTRPQIDWAIVGGESGPGARPMHPDWACTLRDQCQGAGVPFFFKQWGEWTPGENVDRMIGHVDVAVWFDGGWRHGRENLARDDGHIDDQPDVYRVGKKRAGRLLDGREWNEFPDAAPPPLAANYSPPARVIP